jgi:hypothetical protein
MALQRQSGRFRIREKLFPLTEIELWTLVAVAYSLPLICENTFIAQKSTELNTLLMFGSRQFPLVYKTSN